VVVIRLISLVAQPRSVREGGLQNHMIGNPKNEIAALKKKNSYSILFETIF
jgi:hypothetical protein